MAIPNEKYMGHAVSNQNAIEKSKELDLFQVELQSLSNKFDDQINRLEEVAVRFRGRQPQADGKSNEEVKPIHKLEELNRLNARIDIQLIRLGSIISDLERI